SQVYPQTVFVGMDLTAHDGDDNPLGLITSSSALFSEFDFQYGGPVGDALDTVGVKWAVSGNQPWFIEKAVTHDGLDALQSGGIGHGKRWKVEALFLGPATLTFWWKVSSEAGADRLTLMLNGTEQFGVSGEVDWEQRNLSLPVGVHTLAWIYAKNDT